MSRILWGVLFNAVIVGIMAEKCTKSDETEKDLLEVALNLAKEHPDASVVKDVLTCKRDDIKVTKLSQVCSHIVFQVAFGDQSFAVKKLRKGKENDVHAKSGLAAEAKGFIRRQQLFPGLTPVMYCWSDKLNCLAMEDLSSYKSLKKQLTSGDFNMSTIHRVADSIAQMHKATHVNSQPALFKELAKEFQDSSSIQSLNNLFKFNVDSLKDGRNKEAMRRLQTSSGIKSSIASLVETAKNKKQALLHGKLVGESILVKGDDIKLTSGHSLFVGPCAFDIGFLLAEYLYTYYDHMLTPENNDWHRKISYKMVEAANESVKRYLVIMGEYLKDGQDDFISDVAAFCGVQLINRALSASDFSKSVEILESGERLLNASKRIHNVDRLVVIALMLTF